MSYQYPQYPNYPQPPLGLGGMVPPIPGQPPTDTPPTYTPLTPSPDTSWAEVQSARLTSIAAGKPPAELGVKASDAPADYPMAMYNSQTRTTKSAGDKQEEAKLMAQGYSTTPYPAQDPNALTPADVQALQQLWTAAGDALKKLAHMVEQQQQQQQPQPPGQGQWAQQQQQYPTGYAPTGD
jgi:hypothetical protein